MTDTRLETLSAPPSLAGAFARAVLTGRGKSGKGPLPDSILRLQDQRVDRGHLATYQRLCGWSVGDVLPHTYPHVLGFGLQATLMARPGFPLALAGLVHVENVATVHRRITAAEPLTISVHSEALRTHPKGMVVDLVTEVESGGERVWDGRSTYLARGTSHSDAVHTEPPAMPTGHPSARWRLPADLGRTYAAVSGDVNPIHLYPLTAKAMGFPRAIAHGMWTYARTLAALGPVVDGPSTSHVWFRKPVLLPGAVELVIDKQPTGAVTAGLRSAKKSDTEHLVLTLSAH